MAHGSVGKWKVVCGSVGQFLVVFGFNKTPLITAFLILMIYHFDKLLECPWVLSQHFLWHLLSVFTLP